MRSLVEDVETHWVRIYISGPLETALQVCREDCWHDGLCVTVDRTHFIYTGGEESGVVVGLVNYPRFPSSADALWGRAERLALLLRERMCQRSVLVMSPTLTRWFNIPKDETVSQSEGTEPAPTEGWRHRLREAAHDLEDDESAGVDAGDLRQALRAIKTIERLLAAVQDNPGGLDHTILDAIDAYFKSPVAAPPTTEREDK